MVIKMDEKQFSWSTNALCQGQNFCDTNADARSVCDS